MPEKINLMDDIVADLNLKDMDEVDTENEVEDETIEEDEIIEDKITEDEEDDDDNTDGEADDDDDDDDDDADPEDKEDIVDLEEDEEFEPRKKPSKEEKMNFAFEKQRKELKEKEAKLKELDEIAQAYGYTDHESMLKRMKDDAITKQAKEKGLPPEIYKQMQEQSAKLARMEAERESEHKASQVKQFLSNVDTFSQKYKLTEPEKEMLIDQLDNAGFTVDTLVKVKEPEKLFTGYMSDKVLERYRQSLINNDAKKKSLEEKTFKNPKSGNEKASYDALLKDLFSTKGTNY